MIFGYLLFCFLKQYRSDWQANRATLPLRFCQTYYSYFQCQTSDFGCMATVGSILFHLLSDFSFWLYLKLEYRNNVDQLSSHDLLRKIQAWIFSHFLQLNTQESEEFLPESNYEQTLWWFCWMYQKSWSWTVWKGTQLQLMTKTHLLKFWFLHHSWNEETALKQIDHIFWGIIYQQRRT